MDLDQLVITTSFGNVFAMSAGSASAPLVLAIHGWSQRNGWHTWESLMAPLGAAGFHVVSVDMPGWGKSVTDEPGPLVGERAEELGWRRRPLGRFEQAGKGRQAHPHRACLPRIGSIAKCEPTGAAGLGSR
jgi:pimeloyl-ACP methyl ester carboxylesterase